MTAQSGYPCCATAAEQKLTGSWDMDEADEQPRLDAQVRRWQSGKQLTELPPALEAWRGGSDRAAAAGEAREGRALTSSAEVHH